MTTHMSEKIIEIEPNDSERELRGQQGKIGWVLAWLIGVPLPLLLVIYLFTRVC